MQALIYVAAGGALGACLRYGLIQLVMRLHVSPFPLGTMVVNLLGALAIGLMMMKLQHDHLRLLLVSGLLGGFTTFSAFSWDAVQLMLHGQQVQAIIYVVGSVMLCLIGVMLGSKLAGLL